MAVVDQRRARRQDHDAVLPDRAYVMLITDPRYTRAAKVVAGRAAGDDHHHDAAATVDRRRRTSAPPATDAGTTAADVGDPPAVDARRPPRRRRRTTTTTTTHRRRRVGHHDVDRRRRDTGQLTRPGRRSAAAGRPARRHADVRPHRRRRPRVHGRRHRLPGAAGHPDRHRRATSSAGSSSEGPLLEVEPSADLDRLHFVQHRALPARVRGRADGTRRGRLMFASLVQGPLLRLFPVGMVAARAAAHDVRRPAPGRRDRCRCCWRSPRRPAPAAGRRRARSPGSCSG